MLRVYVTAISGIFLLLATLEWMPWMNTCGAHAPRRLDPERVNVQIIGDSISKGMMRNAHYPENWAVFHPGASVTGGCKNTEHGLKCLPKWLGAHHWDIIILNFGLHDIGLDYEHVKLNTYVENLRNILQGLKRYGTKVFWVSTTPVPSVPLKPPRTQCDVSRYNSAAEKIMQENNVTIIHLNKYVQNMCYNYFYSECPGIQLDNNVHFTSLGYAKMAEYVVSHVDLPENSWE